MLAQKELKAFFLTIINLLVLLSSDGGPSNPLPPLFCVLLRPDKQFCINQVKQVKIQQKAFLHNIENTRFT